MKFQDNKSKVSIKKIHLSKGVMVVDFKNKHVTLPIFHHYIKSLVPYWIQGIMDNLQTNKII